MVLHAHKESAADLADINQSELPSQVILKNAQSGVPVELGDYPKKDILTEREVCCWLGISEPTLFRHRRAGTGPRFIRLSERRVAYHRAD